MDPDTSLMPVHENPYIGPRPFLTGEKTRFFGRDREAELLIPLIISERLVLFYAQSGAGKSSLLNAKIIPGLQERNFITLSGRVSGSELSKEEVRNIFTYNLLVSLDPEKSKSKDLRHTSLSEYLADLEVDAFPTPEAENGSRPLDAPQIIDGVQPLVLIIDQFEELFNSHPEAWDQRGPFFDQICEAMLSDPYLWVVLTIREDYIAQLDPFAGQLPGRLRARFYMQRMKKDAALEAVARPVENTSPFAPDAAKALVDSLSMITVGRDENKAPIFAEGEFVEPVQLQVVCYQLWENLKPKPGSTITIDDLNRVAGDQNLAGFIVQALRQYYEGVLQNVLQELRDTGRPISERALREWFSTAMITEDGTRASVFRGETHTGTLPNYVVDLLDRRFIIRGEMRAGGRWYELVHDRLIQPVRRSNAEWLAANTTKLTKDAQAWKQNPDQARLYDGRLLKEALELQKKGELTPLENEFIRESEEESERRRAAARRNRRLLIGSAIAAVVFMLVAVFAIRSWGAANAATAQAERSLGTAQAAEASALSEKAAAETASASEAVQRGIAQTAEARARSSRDAAVTQEAIAVAALDAQKESDRETLISRLAAYAKYYVAEAKSRNLSLLFAVAAWKQGNGAWEAREALSYTLWSAYKDGPYNILVTPFPEPFLSSDSSVFALDINNQGTLLATGGNGGLVNVWDMQEKKKVTVPEELQNDFRVYSLQFSPDDRYLAVGGGEGRVKIWDIQENRMLKSYRPDGKEALIHALGFDASSRYLALGLGDGRLIIYSLDEEKKIVEFFEPSGDIWSVAWSPTSHRVAYGGKTGFVSIFNPKTQQREKLLSNVLFNPVQGLVWSKDGRYLYAGNQGRRLIRWEVDAEGTQVLISRKEDTEPITSLDLNAEGSVLVSGSINPQKSVTLWDANTLRPVGSPRANNSWVRAVAFDGQGKYFASGGDDYRAFIYEISSLNPLGRLTATIPGGGIMALGRDAREGVVAVRRLETGANQTLQLYNVSTMAPLSDPYPVRYDQLQLARRDGQLVLALARPGEVLLADPRTGQPLAGTEPIVLPNLPVTALGISPDGKVLGAALCSATSPEPGDPIDPKLPCLKSQLLFWDLEAWREIRPPGWGPQVELNVTSLGISPDGQVVLGRGDGYISFFALNSNLILSSDVKESPANPERVIRTDFSPDGKLLFTATLLGDLQIWDAAARRSINVIGKQADDSVTGVLFELDSQNRLRMFASTRSGNIRDWDLDPESWTERACALIGDDLNEDEVWKQNFPSTPKPGPICLNP